MALETRIIIIVITLTTAAATITTTIKAQGIIITMAMMPMPTLGGIITITTRRVDATIPTGEAREERDAAFRVVGHSTHAQPYVVQI